MSQINLQHSQDASAELSKILTDTGGSITLIQKPYCYRNQIRGIGVSNPNNTNSNNTFKLVIASVYLPYDIANLPPMQNLERLVLFAKGKGLPLLIGCDANAHHTIWGSTNTNARGTALLE